MNRQPVEDPPPDVPPETPQEYELSVSLDEPVSTAGAGAREPVVGEAAPDAPGDPRPETPPGGDKGWVRVDVGRPWPLGVPSEQEALEAMAGRLPVDATLAAVHAEFLSLMPEAARDDIGASLAGVEEPVARAYATAWRAMVAAECHADALGVDGSAAQALASDAVQARELLRASTLLALDGGASLEGLLTALGGAIERLTGKVAFKARPRRSAAAHPAVAGPVVFHAAKAVNALRWAFVVTLVVTVLFHAVSLLGTARSDAWVVVGDVERGTAFLAPAREDADEASLEKARADLAARGYSTVRTPSGQWAITSTRRAAR